MPRQDYDRTWLKSLLGHYIEQPWWKLIRAAQIEHPEDEEPYELALMIQRGEDPWQGSDPWGESRTIYQELTTHQ